jgi:hypothetical protein
MRNIYLLATALLFSTTLFSQSDVYFEDFEDGSLAGFTMFNVDGLTPDDPDLSSMADSAWTIKTITSQGWTYGKAAFSVSWYIDDVGPSDDWLITPAIEIGESSMLYWDAMAITSSGNYRDRYQVFIGTTNVLEDFFDLAPVFDTGSEGEIADPTDHSFDLGAAGYANQTIYIAFRNNTEGGAGNELAIDNIRVSSILSTENIEVFKDLKVQPNPSNGDFALSLNLDKAENTTLEVVDITGKILRKEVLGNLAPGSHFIQVERGSLVNGIYLMRLKSENSVSVIRAVLN